MENNTLISHELEEMRSQLGLLKDKLEKQTIVNEKHIRKSMTSKASSLNRTVSMTIVLGVFALIYPAWFFHTLGVSISFLVATIIMMAVCLGITIVQRINLSRLDFSKGNLVQTAEILSKLRKHYKDWMKIAIPMVIIWFSWLIYEILTHVGISPLTMGLCAGALIGGLIGGVAGSRINRKVIRNAEEILDHIKELQATE